MLDSLLEARILQIQQNQLQRIMNKWKDMLRTDFKNGGDRKSYAWLKDDWRPPITAVRPKNEVLQHLPVKL